MSRLRRIHREEEVVVDESIKFAASKASPSLAGILSHHLPDDMAHFTQLGQIWRLTGNDIKRRGELVFWGTGIIYESHRVDDDGDGDDEMTVTNFTSIIICPATLFVRTNGVEPSDIQVDVYLWDGQIHQGRVIACDFHYNLAAIRIQTPCQLPTATLRDLDDFVPINLTPIQYYHQPPRLRPHSTKFKISPGTPLITIARSMRLLNAPILGSGVFSPRPLRKEECSELYCVWNNNHPEKKGAFVINYSGEVIGLVFYKFSFLPINLVSIWWKNFKSCRQYHRPCLGVKIANLHSSGSKYLSEFLAVFPNVTGGAVVTEVAEDSPTYCSGICPEDVIIKCNGKLVRSSLELFEIVWNNVGIEYVELDVLRASNAENLSLSLKVEQTPPNKMWAVTPWTIHNPFEPVRDAEWLRKLIPQ
ncbi:putative protease Do-like 14 isoform X2 [Silene latifolia]|uniref:putative protease Do-like 14 isoform X2 n=1 Tax=Silene latifolia TaxID=37657 RepID=UPI003D771BB4